MGMKPALSTPPISHFGRSSQEFMSMMHEDFEKYLLEAPEVLKRVAGKELGRKLDRPTTLACVLMRFDETNSGGSLRNSG
jgi:hypothetical protein